MSLIAVRDLHVHLGESHVLQGVAFDVPEGGVTALLGRNGNGKPEPPPSRRVATPMP